MMCPRKVGHRPVGDFDRLPIQGLVARVVGGEALVQDLEELSANVGDDQAPASSGF